MTIDHGPAIKAFAQQRKHELATRVTYCADHQVSGRMDELDMIIALCEGLEKQNVILNKAQEKGTVEA